MEESWNWMFRALEVTGSAQTRSTLMFVHYIIRLITKSVKKRVKRASRLLELIVFGIWLQLVIWFRSMALNLGINLSRKKPEGCCFVRLGLY